MPIYIVRWPDLSASLVQAEGEEHLLDILDQVGNADDCEWSIYDGPLFIDFRLPVQWSIEEPAAIQGNPRRVVIGDIGELAGGNIIENMQLSLAEGDDGHETGAAVLRLAFPKLHAAMEDDAGDEPTGRDQSVAEAGLRRALHAELDRGLNASQTHAQLEENTDAISRLAGAMDLPVQLARKFHEMAAEHESSESHAQNIVQNRPPLGPTLFRISNHHTHICGQPPTVDGDQPAKYHGYFANRYGEQAVFIYDTDTHQASVRMGDAGWDNVHCVVDGRVEGIILNEEEAAWIRACWLATAKGFRSPS